MEDQNFIGLPACTDSGGENEGQYDGSSSHELGELDSQLTTSQDKMGHESDAQYEDGQFMPEANLQKDLVNNDSDMEIEDISSIPALSNSSYGIQENGIHNSNHGTIQNDRQRSTPADIRGKLISENLGHDKGDVQGADSHCISKAFPDKDLVENSSHVEVSVKMNETLRIAELNARMHPEKGFLVVQDESHPIGTRKTGGNSISGVKRSRVTFEEQQPSVHVTYNSITRASKLKLEELLQQWSEWHAKHDSSSQDPAEVLESGEETFFPALHVGLENTSAVFFWMDNQKTKQENGEFIPLDDNSVPLYDRGFALGLTSEGASSNLEGGLEIIGEAARCFNCGSYSHSLKTCPKPRNNTAVNNARKNHKSKRNQNSGSRNPTRYYQNSPAGKFDGLRPGALDTETRKLLGIGELDPPPWLNRMREIGYPPGYLDPDDEDQPSGIIIFADGEIKEEQEDGEIIEQEYSKPQMKMTVEFPGVNAPIPENADEDRWAAVLRSQSHRRLNHSSESVSRGHHREQRLYRDSRDDGPPGVESGFSPPMSSYPRYSSYDHSYSSPSSRGNTLRPRSPMSGRSQSERGRRSSLVDEGYSNHVHYGSLPNTRLSDYGSSRYENWNDGSINDYDLDYSTHSMRDRHRHYSRR
ncbi:hypothetical protein FEM48_Zijuj04G0068800 [Ziziphus jujuba var. spinosa]|uniref:CCHC-type domain-containing protein n=1 Tax=Ziziphus jujuba var. spinosa TaxID=714518 RepID=A0A978VIF4_ZIZJJ|nr:hypothetical protein FEM48_Zijuj04G0068800 [Ziziphus jujuba var. spinosa]